jgi:hypothetical protein
MLRVVEDIFPQIWFDFQWDAFYLNLESNEERTPRGNRRAPAKPRCILLDKIFCKDFKSLKSRHLHTCLSHYARRERIPANIYALAHQFGGLKSWLAIS